MKKEKTVQETKDFLKEAIENGDIIKGGFIEEAIKFDIEYREEESKEND